MGGRTVWNSEGKGGLSILEFPKARGSLDEDAARGRVWIFSGITHLLTGLPNHHIWHISHSINDFLNLFLQFQD